MFKKLIFRKTNNFNSKPVILELDKHINVIIGPKGGGKSTLFDLLVGLKNNCIYENVIKALKEYNLKFEEAITFGNEKINVEQLTKKGKKEKNEDYQKRNDVIYQDDPIKKDLTSFSEIENDKYYYLKKQIEISNDVNDLINHKIKNLYDSMNIVYKYSDNNHININWSNTFKMDEINSENKFNLITNLDYKIIPFEEQINKELNELEMAIKNIHLNNGQLKKINSFNFNKEIDELNFVNELTLIIKQINELNFRLHELIQNRQKLIKKIKLMTECFYQSYRLTLEKIKKENFTSSGLASYETQAKNHFKNFALNVYKLRKDFEYLLQNDIILDIPNDINQNSSLTYFISEKIKFDTDNVINLLKVVFHTPGSSREDVTKWLKALSDKGIKEFDEAKLFSAISRELKNNVRVLVDNGRDYETLSLGQRSIYGLKYKFNQSIQQDLFLDQPEDNLDNETITKEILSLIPIKKNQQIFIVTHNANIGILSNPEKIIVANLLDDTNPYNSIHIKEIMNENFANYLEGGKEYLKSRFKKIIEGNKDEMNFQ